ncbi:MAG TPA: lysophospholipase [Ktedonobacteraceae bacterium]|jgi:alpha-beta hydrolase superfamily lysophospholipase|nr:lysophospholipase [Ktedonobacteraceae bacterium]
MLYSPDAPGDWGQMQGSPTIRVATEELPTADGCKLFLRSWDSGSSEILLILHGLGAHSGWFIDMCNSLASHGLTVYAMDHRGFGRSEGLAGHIDDYHTFLADIAFIVTQIRTRHPGAKLYILGHSMGGIFATYFAAQDQDIFNGVLFLNPWVADTSKVSVPTTLGILLGGLFKSKHYWQVAFGTDKMTTNPEAVKMLNADTFWRLKETSSFFFQIFLMRSGILARAKQITIPALVIQAEDDKSVVPEASHKLYEAIASKDKMWVTLPHYEHDSEFEADRSLLDNTIAAWIKEHATSSSKAAP